MVKPKGPMEPDRHPKTGGELPLFDRARFRGSDYDPKHDRRRLSSGLALTVAVMSDGAWRTKPEIQGAILEAHGKRVSCESIGRYLRYAKDPENGGHELEKRRRGDPADGYFEYRFGGVS